MNRRAVPILLLVMSTVAVLGCSRSEPFPVLYPLSGTVEREGMLVTNGGLIFILDSGERTRLVVNAAVQPDGSFTARTERVDAEGTTIRLGAPIGIYKVIYHPPGDGAKTDQAVQVEQEITIGSKPNNIAITLPSEVTKGAGSSKEDVPERDPENRSKKDE